MTVPIPEIATYELRSSDLRAPKWIAKYAHGGDLLPATFEGATEIEAYDAACAFWTSEQRALVKARIARGERAA